MNKSSRLAMLHQRINLYEYESETMEPDEG